MRWQCSQSINAPASLVFQTVADPTKFQRAVGADPEVEFLTSQHTGVGTKFRASRLNKGKRMTFDQEVAEYVPDRVVRMLNITHGVLWDSTFEVDSGAKASTLTLTMYSRTNNPIKRLTIRLIGSAVGRQLSKDLDAIKAYVEGQARGRAGDR